MTIGRATHSTVVPANAGMTHIPEGGVWGTMGPCFRGDDSWSED